MKKIGIIYFCITLFILSCSLQKPFDMQKGYLTLDQATNLVTNGTVSIVTNFEGTWLLTVSPGNVIFSNTQTFTFSGGQGTVKSTNGSVIGNGFRYTLDGYKLTLSNAYDEGLVDTGASIPFYLVLITGNTMKWVYNQSNQTVEPYQFRKQ